MADWNNRIVGLEYKPAHQFLANVKNPRKHPAHQREALRGSLDTLGWYDVVIENRQTGELIDGHARIEETLTRDENALVPVLIVDMSQSEQDLALASHDFISSLAEYDRQSLDDLLKDVQTDDARLQVMLSELAQNNDLYFGDKPEEIEAPEPQVDRAEELNKQWQVKRGDLWIIPSVSGNGEHRLLCGDSTRAEDVARLMGDDKAGACITDSPYGINQEGIANDSPEGLENLFSGILSNLPITDGVVINFQSPRMFPVWLDTLRKCGGKFERMLWMYKSNDVSFVWRGWLTKSECIVVSSVGKAEWNTPSEYSHDCYSINWDKTTMIDVEGWHASIKPPLIIKNLIDNTCGLVYDPFGGSGTTMAACEQLNRQCRMIEIEPNYCAVILQRMSDMGLTPYCKESLTNGKTNETNS